MDADLKDVNFVLASLLNAKEMTFSSDSEYITSNNFSLLYIEQILDAIKRFKPEFISFARTWLGIKAIIIQNKENDIKEFLDNGGFKQDNSRIVEYGLKINPKHEPIDPETQKKIDSIARLTTDNIEFTPPQHIIHIDYSTYINAPVTNSNIAKSMEGGTVNIADNKLAEIPNKTKARWSNVLAIAGIIVSIMIAILGWVYFNK